MLGRPLPNSGLRHASGRPLRPAAAAFNNIVSMRWINLLRVILLLSHLLVRANIHDDENANEFAAAVNHLPGSSSSDVLLASHSCSGDYVKSLLENGSSSREQRHDYDDPFLRWVLSAIHKTWDPPGWDVALPAGLNRNKSSSGGGDDITPTTVEGDNGDKYYARVFDLLNWSRERNVFPIIVDIASICHKGMNSTNTPEGGGRNNIPDGRQSAGLLPPMKVNNPCHYPYRMVDGAHRICLRKFILHVATAELVGLENLVEAAAAASASATSGGEAEENNGRTTAANPPPNDDDDDDGARSLRRRMRELREVIGRTRYAPYLVLNQTTFESMLTSVDPHSSWARDKHHLTRVVTGELRMDWQAWMGRVMDRVVGNVEDDSAALKCSSMDGSSE